MTKRDIYITRREALAGVGAVGFATAGVAHGRSTGSWNGYTNYTYAASTGPRILVGWRGTYNGDPVIEGPTDPEEFVDGIGETGDHDGDVRLVDADNVLPEDYGTASVGLRAEDAPARVWMKLEAASNELADRIQIVTRYDSGLFGIGGCVGAENDPRGAVIASGMLSGPETVSSANGDLLTGVELDPGVLDNGCLDEDEGRCLAFAWTLPTGQGNVGSGQSAAFALRFRATDCDDPNNPFDPSENDDTESEEAGA